MGWVFLDDRFPEHPKVVEAGDEAGWMFTCGMAYVNRNGTLGLIPKGQVPKLTGWRNPMKVAALLVKVGLWHDEGDHYRVHDYADWNRSALQRKEKATRAARARWDAQSKPSSNAQASVEHVPEPPEAHAFPQAPIPIPSSSSSRGNFTTPPDDRSDDDDDQPGIVEAALWLLAERRLADRERSKGPVPMPEAWLQATVRDLRKRHTVNLDQAGSYATPEQLADWLEPPALPQPIDLAQAAARRQQAKADLPKCPACDGTGWDYDERPGGAVRCSACNGNGTLTTKELSQP